MTDFDKIEFKNWTIAKMVVYTGGIIGICLTIGAVGGNWQEWRTRTEQRVNTIEEWKNRQQMTSNETRDKYNRSIKTN